MAEYSGVFTTKKEEVQAVEAWVALLAINDIAECATVEEVHEADEWYKSITVEPYDGDPDDGDVLMTLPDGREFKIEVKREAGERWDAFHQFGFEGPRWRRSPVNAPRAWTSKPWEELGGFDKPSKVVYSGADIWLFYSDDCDDPFFVGYAFCRDRFKELEDKAPKFVQRSRVGNKRIDMWWTGVSFVNPEDLKQYEVVLR